jgi:hypothetical protein
VSVVHIVLFRPKPSLTSLERASLAQAIEAAASQIPGVRRFDVGRQLPDGPDYKAGTFRDYPFCALIEFDDEAALRTYLAHDGHRQLGAKFNHALEAAFIADYEMTDASGASALDPSTLTS